MVIKMLRMHSFIANSKLLSIIAFKKVSAIIKSLHTIKFNTLTRP